LALISTSGTHADRIKEDEARIASMAPIDSDVDEWRTRIKQIISLKDDEGDSQDERDEKKRVRSAIAAMADEMALVLESASDEDVLEMVRISSEQPESNAESLKKFRGFPGVLLLLADGLTVLERSDLAREIYSLAVDLAPTPQAQMEVGYLLASRGSIEFPAFWANAENDVSPAILLLPDKFMGHQGLPYFEVVYEELLPGPHFPDKMALLRLALEAYGRVFAYCYPTDDAGATLRRGPGNPLEVFLMDGLHALLAKVDSYDMNLVVACMQTLWEWFGGSCEAVEDRLQISQTYLTGFERGSAGAHTAEEVDRDYRKTIAIDPDVQLRAAIRAEMSALPARSRNAVEQLLRERFPRWRLPTGVHDYLVLAEVEFRDKQRSGGDFRSVVNSYGNAAESYLQLVTRLDGVRLGQFASVRSESLRNSLNPKSPLGNLIRQIRVLAELRNPDSHGSAEFKPSSEGEADGARHLTHSIIEILSEYKRGRGDGD
jgi:hypothetical protein